ncbi:bifunctional hydroxymethylpyrimidine kinase/phosphomethylpyrimidine kinase [Sphingopyxis sp. GW247-27LB]|uniref:bifunctional hydroxymethylpyrimidine kinase/phosphomethylpyrimidine kinase n=1 Tax=Sphingopyxis sp. GW247-27LB TaxID=2012632 RepID=UPI000BA6ECD3|nr:bifunctional hydroxymethylpyrimidine kinase/phosphomethylpyrimidine kinase [Sphingopyxis sp. GW247-27LB]PAL25247.1 bifunctional hydroxymethylpyrimidine kinase/phosphomethylpyrimidine kinase [Sphingopyxis sp. GW247-27LB]
MTARVLIIAGSDSGGGAGIQADIKTVTMLGGHAMTAIAAITAQNTLGVQGVHPVPTDMVLMQIDSIASDIGVDAVKIGMIGSAETAAAVAERLARPDLAGAPVVFDPVMVSTSGSVLADAATIRAFEALLARAAVATPNLGELAALGGEEAILAHGCALLVKGGHGEGDTVTDRLLEPDAGEVARWEAPRIDTPHTHGTGCTLASAIACGLAQGMPIEPAVARARDFVRLALLDAPGLGEGHGPMGQQAVRNDGLFTGPALNQITLPATDYAASVAFYKQMGLTQIVDSPGAEGIGGYARFEAANGVTLSIHVGDGTAGGATAYLESGALDAWVAYLARRGVRFDQMPKDEEWGWREARLTDPAGNRLCLYQAGEYRRYPPWRI